MDLNTEWMNFIQDSSQDLSQYSNSYNETTKNSHHYVRENTNNNIDENIPKCSDLYISTKTMIGYLNSPVDLINIFWQIPIPTSWLGVIPLVVILSIYKSKIGSFKYSVTVLSLET